MRPPIKTRRDGTIVPNDDRTMTVWFCGHGDQDRPCVHKTRKEARECVEA